MVSRVVGTHVAPCNSPETCITRYTYKFNMHMASFLQTANQMNTPNVNQTYLLFFFWRGGDVGKSYLLHLQTTKNVVLCYKIAFSDTPFFKFHPLVVVVVGITSMQMSINHKLRIRNILYPSPFQDEFPFFVLLA